MHFVDLRVIEASPEGIPLGVVDIKLSKFLLINYYFTPSSEGAVRDDNSKQWI